MRSRLRALRDRDRSAARHSAYVFPGCIPFGRYRGLPMRLVPQKYLEEQLQNENLTEESQALLLQEFERRRTQETAVPQTKISFGRFKGRNVSDLSDDELLELSMVVRESNRQRWQATKYAVADEMKQRCLLDNLDESEKLHQTAVL